VVLVVALKNMHIAQSREEAFYHARNRHALRGVKACGRLFMGGSLKNMHFGRRPISLTLKMVQRWGEAQRQLKTDQ
jgi:hypothetical protein